MDAWSRQTFYYRKRIPDYRTEGVVGGELSCSVLTSLRVLQQHVYRSGFTNFSQELASNLRLLQQHGSCFIQQKKASLSRSFFENIYLVKSESIQVIDTNSQSPILRYPSQYGGKFQELLKIAKALFQNIPRNFRENFKSYLK